MTKSALSAASGVSRALIDDYLKGRRQPSVAQLQRLGMAAGLRLDLAWSRVEVAHDARLAWTQPSQEMRSPPLTMTERARVLELVCATAMALPARERKDLEFPPFRTLVHG